MGLSALKHGFFRRGFMLCDRCILNGKCEQLVPGGECAVEKTGFASVVSDLTVQYALDGLADEILVERVAMYLIRVARAEVYEANVGVSGSSVAWGEYIARLDGMLRVFLRELALTRASRMSLQRNDALAEVDDLLSAVERKVQVERRVAKRYSPSRSLKKDLASEKRKLTTDSESE